MSLTTLIIGIIAFVFLLLIIFFPEFRTLLKGFARVFIKDMASTPEGAAAIYGEKIEEAAKQGLDKADFERCRRVATAGYIRLFDSSEEIADDVMMNSWFSGVDPFDMPKLLDGITMDYCTELLCSVLLNEKRTVSVIKPMK